MALQYYLIPNHMTPDPDDHMAVSINPVSYTIEDVYDHMTREGSTITTAEALAAFEEVMQGIINLVQQGHSVVTPLANISPSISGVFKSDEDTFDPSRHKVGINVTPGLRLRDTASEIPTEKVASREREPAPIHYYDNASETQDEIVTPDGGARITGSLLKFDETDANQGIFFVNTADGTETRVESSMLRNKPGELIFINPNLPAGNYRLEVRSLLEGTTQVRSGALSDELSVAG